MRKLVWNIFLVVCLVGIVLLVWRYWSGQIAGIVGGALSFLGFGSKGVARGVKKRAKKKADAVGPHPLPGIDATERLESRRRASN